MEKVAVVVDSTVCLPKDLVEQYRIEIVPIGLVIGGTVYRDGLDMMPSEFYEMLKTAVKLPTTSPSSPGGYFEAYKRASERANAILCLAVSSKLSAMMDSARAAKKMAETELPGVTIEVMDSMTAGGAEGFIALGAARAAQTGSGLKEVISIAEELRAKTSFIVLMDTLYYLAKGGRIPKAAAWAGSLLNLKPIIELAHGEVKLADRPRTRTKGIEHLLTMMRERVGSKPVHVAVSHAASLEEGQRLMERVAKEFNCVELFLSEFTPVMGTHAGPGVLSLVFYTED
ncbi:MAG: DegV family protein [Chloroflexi bacterium]|nr:DegV family protein [Chloroflexota bacterium]